MTFNQFMSSPKRFLYVFNFIWIIFLILCIRGHGWFSAFLNGLLLFVFNYEWLKYKYQLLTGKIEVLRRRVMLKFKKKKENEEKEESYPQCFSDDDWDDFINGGYYEDDQGLH